MNTDNSVFKNSPLAKRVIIYMILFSASITLVTTAIQLYNEYKRDMDGLDALYSQVENVHLRSFTHSLWATNYSELRVQMEGLVTLPNVVYASVYSGKKLIVETGEVNSKNIIERKYVMEYEFLGKKHVIGKLTIVTTLDNIYAELMRDAITIFMNNALRTLLVVVFMYYIFYRLISRHISRMSEHFKNISLDEYTPLELDRERQNTPDELDFLVSSANEMQQRIINSYKAFNESQKKFHTLTAVAPVGIVYSDVQGYCLYVNEKWSEISGMNLEQAEGNGWTRGLHPDDMDRVFNEWNLCTRNAVPFKLEYRFKNGDDVRWVIAQATAEKNEAGDIIGYVGTITDISERKKIEQALMKSEKQLRIMHSQVPGVVYQFKMDVDGKKSLPYVSPVVEGFIGVTAQEVMGDADKWFDMVHPDDLPNLQKTTYESLVNLTVWNWEGRFIRDDGEVVWMQGTSTPERLKDGSTLWYGLFIDITERVKTDEIMRSSQKMDALGKLTGGIAHDYNNMLGVVLGYSEILVERLNENPELLNYAKKIIHAGERGAKLTKKLLAFSKNKAADVEKVSINAVLNDERHMLEKTLTARIKLEYNLNENLWPVYIDACDLEDAVLNMSINAMHAIESSGSLIIETNNISVAGVRADELGLRSGDYVQLVMTDTGHGIDEATREKIFDPFYTTKGEKGTGLGLSQVYGFVHRSGGVIEIDSEVNEGTRFALYFPRYTETGDSEKSIEEEKNEIDLYGKEKVLIVDDEPELLELMNEILTDHDYQVYCAESAERALDIMETEQIDLLLSDIIMPDMDGYELASVVKEKYPETNIQLVSGYSNPKSTDKVDTELFENRLSKPCEAKNLLKRVRKILQNDE